MCDLKNYILGEPINTGAYTVIYLTTDNPVHIQTIIEIVGIIDVDWAFDNHYRIYINQLHDEIEIWYNIDNALVESNKPLNAIETIIEEIL